MDYAVIGVLWDGAFPSGYPKLDGATRCLFHHIPTKCRECEIITALSIFVVIVFLLPRQRHI